MPETGAHDDGLIAKLLVVAINILDALDARILIRVGIRVRVGVRVTATRLMIIR